MKKIKTRKFRLKMLGLFRLGLVLILGIIVFGWRKGAVDAGIEDSPMVRNRIDGIYSVVDVNGNSKVDVLLIYFMNGNLSYSIEYGRGIFNTRYNSTKDISLSNLSKEQIDYVRSIAYFGYWYGNHNSRLYYVAAQEIIWEYLSGIDVYWTSEMRADGPRIDVEEYKNKIINFANEYNKKPDLNFEDGQVFMVGDEIVIEDKNGVLSGYEVVSSNCSNATIEGDNLIIKVGDKIGEERIELKRKGNYGYTSTIYYRDDNSMKLVSVGDYKEVDTVVSFEIKGAMISGQVVGGQNEISASSASLEGAIYELYSIDGDLLGTYESDSNGYFEIGNVASGSYYFKQVKASKGYKINNEIVEVVIDNEDINVILEQELITNDILINKVYGTKDNYKPESDILFYIYDSKDKLVFEGITNEEGRFEVTLPYGKYKVVQQNTTNGYKKGKDFWLEVIEAKEEASYYNLVNDLIQVRVEISTFNKENKEVLVGSEFAYKIWDVKKNTYIDVDGVDVFYANNEGVVVAPIMLEYGDYVLEQVSVPEGIMVFREKINFSINDNSKLVMIDGDLVLKIDVYNEYVKGRVNAMALEEVYYKKENEYGYDRISRGQVEFLLKALGDIVVNDKIIYKDGEELYEGIANEEGELAIEGLYIGEYCLYDKDIKVEKCFRVEDGEDIVGEVIINIDFVKYLDKGNIIIENKSSDNEILSSSIFEVVDNEDEVIYTGVTNNEGIIKLEGVLLGNYCVRQKKVEDNYYLLEDKVCFKVDSDKELKLVNEKIVNKTIKVPNTLEEDRIGIYELLVMLALVGTGYVVYKKIFNSKFDC